MLRRDPIVRYIERLQRRLAGNKPWEEVRERFSFGPYDAARGEKQIAALMNISPRRLRELRDPNSAAYDPVVADTVREIDGTLEANAGVLSAIAAARWVRTCKKRQQAVAQRRDRRGHSQQ